MTEPEVFAVLKPLIAETLGVSPETVRMESGLFRNLGAESIDLLDLSFRVEETFKVTIDSNELERAARERLPGGQYEQDGHLTEAALAELRRLLPEAEADRLVPGLRKADLPSLLTVSFFVRLIARKLAAQPKEAGRA